MSTTITFVGTDNEKALTLVVSEDVESVHDALNAGHGQPFKLTTANGDKPVYVNPATIAYWQTTPQYGTASFN